MSKLEKLLREKSKYIKLDAYEGIMINVEDVLAIIKEIKKLGILAGKCTGGMNAQKVFDTFDEYDVVVGTYQFISEAVDIPALNGLVLATPKSDIQQAIGRLTRTNVEKKSPIVVEIVDVWSNRSKGYAKRHESAYTKFGFRIK